MGSNRSPRQSRTAAARRWRLRLTALFCALLFLAGCGNGSAEAEAIVAEPADEAGVAPANLIELLRINDASSLATAMLDIDFAQVTTDAEYTVFAPNDEAFLALTADETAELLASPEQLIEMLRQHVVAGRLDAADLRDRDTITTVAGTTLEVRDAVDGLRVGGATVIRPDADARPGMAVHVIDTVLQP